MRSFVIIALVGSALGCATIEPGQPGFVLRTVQKACIAMSLHRAGTGSAFSGESRISISPMATHAEQIETLSQEGLKMVLRIALIYRPVRLRALRTGDRIGPTYYDEVVGPEFRSVARGVAARHPYMELHRKNEQIRTKSRPICGGAPRVSTSRSPR